MVHRQLVARGIQDARVLAAFSSVPRELFVPPAQAAHAFADAPLPIGHRQTISQPYIVAYMLEQLQLDPADRVLEIGAGSGYVCALLAALAGEVYAVERIGELLRQARERLDQLGLQAVRLKHGNGYGGWEEHAPYDAILVSASAREVPQPLLRQLGPGGRLITPVGAPDEPQRLLRVVRASAGEYTQELLQGVAFVPLLDMEEDAGAGA
jgi:protein-L-isoaspartate(D-aspartate) O-methyltransferase